jgi:pimeloyl-ACP methyl ester carboxylesterase
MNLILLPGLHGTADLFEPLLKEIPAEVARRVVSYPTREVCSTGRLVGLMEEALAGEEEMVLVAESFSGPLALEFARRHPGRVKGVVLCVSFVLPPVPRILCYLATPLIWLRCPIPGIGIRTFLSGFRAPRGLVREVRRVVRVNSVRVLAARVRQMAWVDARRALGECRGPVMYVGARRDRLVGRRALRRVLRVRQDVEVRMIDGPHLLLQVKPRETWEAVRQLLHTIGACENQFTGRLGQ